MESIDTFDGTRWGFGLYNTEKDCAVAQLHDWVTAGGLNYTEEAREALEAGRDACLAEMAVGWGSVHELLLTDWEECSQRVRELLGE